MERLVLIAMFLCLQLSILPAQSFKISCTKYPHKRYVKVSNSEQLDNALQNVQAGDLVIMQPGLYTPYVNGDSSKQVDIVNKHGTAKYPITLCGGHDAIIDGGAVDGPVPIRIQGSSFITVAGITLRNGRKGIMLEGVTNSILSGLLIDNIGQEGIHMQLNSHNNVVRYCNITNTGRVDPGTGEGVYVGSSANERANDVCTSNQVIYNRIGPGVTAEPIDIKENSYNGLILGNVLDGRDLCGCNSATSLINVKGNGYKILNNVGLNSREDSFRTGITIRGQGIKNYFAGNKCLTQTNGHYCVKISRNNEGNTVACGQYTNGRCSHSPAVKTNGGKKSGSKKP